MTAVAKNIAKFLELPDTEQYTGFSLRRTSKATFTNTGAKALVLKKHGTRKSSTVAEAYDEDSIEFSDDDAIDKENHLVDDPDLEVIKPKIKDVYQESTCNALDTVVTNIGDYVSIKQETLKNEKVTHLDKDRVVDDSSINVNSEELMNVDELPERALNSVERALDNQISEKSKVKYQKAYEEFKKWQNINGNISTVTEDVLLAYFNELSNKYSASSLWVFYSMLRCTLDMNENVQIEGFKDLTAFLRIKNAGYEAKTAKVLTGEELKKFLVEAEDEEYLLMKVVAILSLFGACGSNELYNLKSNDVRECGSDLIVTIKLSKTSKPRIFTVVSEGGVVNYVKIVKKYMVLRPEDMPHNYFFIFYGCGGKCTTQRVGIRKISSVPKSIATFLELPDTEQYTGHSLRKMSDTIFAKA